ncbi:MAG: HK97 gp10 family phage protein [Lachnospiraceae bacterium]|nr:HK97 gp10 family phage protein [Lachnospiraceae bacterium]
MAYIHVSPDGLSEAVYEILKDFDSNVGQAAGEAAQAVAKDARSSLKSASPKRSGKYAAGWSVKTEKSDGIIKEVIVHNKAKPGLAHLLEFGHATKNGTERKTGKTLRRTPAHSHIESVNAEMQEKFVTEVRKRIERGFG